MGIPALPFCKITLKASRPKPKVYPREIKNLADHIRRRRIDLGLFQRQVAEMIGTSEQTVANWEGQHSKPALTLIPAIIRFLGYNPFPKAQSLAGRITRYRTSRGMTQKAVAQKLGIDPSALARWERGNRAPTGLYRKLIERLLGDDAEEVGS